MLVCHSFFEVNLHTYNLIVFHFGRSSCHWYFDIATFGGFSGLLFSMIFLTLLLSWTVCICDITEDSRLLLGGFRRLSKVYLQIFLFRHIRFLSHMFHCNFIWWSYKNLFSQNRLCGVPLFENWFQIPLVKQGIQSRFHRGLVLAFVSYNRI